MNQAKTPSSVLDIRLSGKLNGQDIAAYRTALEAKLQEQQHIGMVCDLTGLADISAEGLAAGSQLDMDFLAHIGQFQRVAFVSDKEWPDVLIGMISALISKPAFRAFASSQREAAVKWVAEATGGSAKPKHEAQMQLIRTSKDDVIGFEINGTVSGEAVAKVIAELSAFLDGHDKVRMLARIKHFNGIDPAAFMQSGLMSMKFAAIQKVERYAVVGAPGWMQKAIKAMNPIFPDVDMRAFAAEDEVVAWKWLGAKAAE